MTTMIDKIACPNALCILVKRNPQFVKFLLGKSTGAEADAGHQQQLAAVAAVSGAFATATEIPMLAVKKSGQQTQALHPQLQLKHRGLR